MESKKNEDEGRMIDKNLISTDDDGEFLDVNGCHKSGLSG
jgi:hypothetical protein